MVDLVEEWEDIARYTRFSPENIRGGSSYQLKKPKKALKYKDHVLFLGNSYS